MLIFVRCDKVGVNGADKCFASVAVKPFEECGYDDAIFEKNASVDYIKYYLGEYERWYTSLLKELSDGITAGNGNPTLKTNLALDFARVLPDFPIVSIVFSRIV